MSLYSQLFAVRKLKTRLKNIKNLIPTGLIVYLLRSTVVGVAQLVERWIVVPNVEGSSPFAHPIFDQSPFCFETRSKHIWRKNAVPSFLTLKNITKKIRLYGF